MERMIRVRGLTVIYDNGAVGVEGVNLDVERGEVIALTGPNGGGKTTILRAVSGLIPSYYKANVKGLIEVEGHRLSGGVDPSRIVYMQPDPSIQVVGVTVLHEATLCPSMAGLPPGMVEYRARNALQMTGLIGMEDKSTPLLSSGLLQRTAIAGVISCGSRYLLLDEPTGHLDESAASIVIDVIEILKRKGIGLLIATHDSRIASISDRSYIVRKTIRKGIYVYKPSVTRGERRPGVVSLRAIGVDVAYPGSDPILRDVNVEARSGELVALIGPNGCGKTTLLRLLSGIMKPLKGRVVARGRRAYLPSNPLLVFSRPTLRDEVDAPPSLPVEDLLDRPIMSLSSGETQLAALAVIVSSGARILLLDEPTHALDPLNKDIVLNTLSNLADDGYTIIAASHDKLLASIADTVYRVECGGVYRE